MHVFYFESKESKMSQIFFTGWYDWVCCGIKDRQKRAILQPQAAAKPVLATTTLWVNGLSTDTKAADLKMLFVKYGKV